MQATILVTIKGPQRSVDLEMPGDTLINELMPMLLEICASPSVSSVPQNPTLWQLGLEGSVYPLPMNRSLINKDDDIFDGAILVLQNMEAWRRLQNNWKPRDIPNIVTWSGEEEEQMS